MSVDIILLDELKEFITPLSKEEFGLLKQNLISEGCRDPLIVWESRNDKFVLIDGHNRYKICKEFNIPFKTKILKFDGIEQVKFWMINNQLGRRNLTPDQMSYYRGLKYESLKKKNTGYIQVKSKGQNEPWTYEKLAEEFKVSASTIKRDAKFSKGLNVIGIHNQKLKNKILSGETKIKKSDVILFSDIDKNVIKGIKNEADFYNKASHVRNSILTDVEIKLKDEREKKIKMAQDELKRRDAPFTDEQEMLNRIKAAIVFATKNAIQNRDTEAMNELKELVERLDILLFGD